MKNNIEGFLCDVPNMGLPAQSVSVVDFIQNSLSGEKYFEIAKLKIVKYLQKKTDHWN